MPKTEARLFRAYWQDGLLDLLAGVTVVVIGIGWLFDFVAIVAIVPALAAAMWPPLRARITAPRLGTMRFNAERMSGLRAGLSVSLAVGIGIGALFVVFALDTGAPSSFERWLAPAIPALLLSFLAAIAASLLSLPRFAGYAAVLLAGGLVAAAFALEPGWSMVLAGGVISAAGAVRLSWFLHEFPRLPEIMS